MEEISGSHLLIENHLIAESTAVTFSCHRGEAERNECLQEGVVERGKHGSYWEREEQGEMRRDNLISDHKPRAPLAFIRLSCCFCGCFPALDFTVCVYWAAENKDNQCSPHPLPSHPPLLSGGDYWLDLKVFFFKTSTESISSPGRRFWLHQGPKPQTLPPVAGKPLQWFVCCQSAL